MDEFKPLNPTDLDKLSPEAYCAACALSLNVFYLRPFDKELDEDAKPFIVDGERMVLLGAEDDSEDSPAWEWVENEKYWRDTSRF